MQCSGCGKDIPFNGTVCPYCQRDKSKDQAYTLVAFIFGIIGGTIGYLMFGVWGAISGFILGCIVAAAATLGGGTKPPEVQVVLPSQVPLTDEKVTAKLTQLRQLYDQGLLTAEEFANKKADIMAKF
jgi:Short C-terminal domain